jgi:hypothetical protein
MNIPTGAANAAGTTRAKCARIVLGAQASRAHPNDCGPEARAPRRDRTRNLLATTLMARIRIALGARASRPHPNLCRAEARSLTGDFVR